jgi:hypothetical protein
MACIELMEAVAISRARICSMVQRFCDNSSAFWAGEAMGLTWHQGSPRFLLAGIEDDRNLVAAGITPLWVISSVNSEGEDSAGVSSKKPPRKGRPFGGAADGL